MYFFCSRCQTPGHPESWHTFAYRRAWFAVHSAEWCARRRAHIKGPLDDESKQRIFAWVFGAR